MKTTVRLTCLAAALTCAFPAAAQTTKAKPKAPTQAQTNAALLEEMKALRERVAEMERSCRPPRRTRPRPQLRRSPPRQRRPQHPPHSGA
jgi:hypothetical protein